MAAISTSFSITIGDTNEKLSRMVAKLDAIQSRINKLNAAVLSPAVVATQTVETQQADIQFADLDQRLARVENAKLRIDTTDAVTNLATVKKSLATISTTIDTINSKHVMLSADTAMLTDFQTRLANQEAVTNRILDTFGEITVALMEENAVLKKNVEEAEKFHRSAKKQQTVVSQITRALVRTWAVISGIRGIALVLNKIMSTINATMSATNKAATALRDTMGSLGTSGIDAGVVAMNKYYFAAQRARTSYMDFAKTTSKFMMVAPSAFGTDNDAIRFTETLTKSLSLAGATTEEVNSVLMQVSQGLSSGYLQGDELRALRENGGLAAAALAKYMNTSVGGLKQLGAEGKITADVLVAALSAAEKDIDDKFAELPMTAGQALTKAGNYMKRSIEPLVKQVNAFLASEKFIKFSEALRKAWDNIARILKVVVIILTDGIAPVVTIVLNALNALFDALRTHAVYATTAISILTAAVVVLGWKITESLGRSIWTIATQIGSLAIAFWPVTLVILIIAGLLLGIAAILKHVGVTASLLGGVFYAIGYAVGWLWQMIQAFFWGVLTVITVVGGIITTVFLGALAVIATVIIGLIAAVLVVLNLIASAAATAAGTVASNVGNIVNKVVNGIIDVVNLAIRGLNKLIDLANKIPKVNIGKISEFSDSSAGLGMAAKGDEWKAEGKDMLGAVDTIFDAAGNRISGIWGNVGGVSGTIFGWADGFMGKADAAYGSAGDVGSKWGSAAEGWFNNLPSSLLDPESKEYFDLNGENMPNAENAAGGAGGGDLGSIADDTNDIKNLLTRIRDLAERTALQQFTSINVDIDMQNDIGETDLDGVITYVNNKVEGAMNNTLAGVL